MKFVLTDLALVFFCLCLSAQQLSLGKQNGVVVANSETNVVYRSYQNKLQIAAPEYSTLDLVAEAKGAKLTKKGDYWICEITAAINVIKIDVIATQKGKNQMVGEIILPVCDLPTPVAYIMLSNGEICNTNKGIEKTQFDGAKVVIENEYANLNVQYVVKSFKLVVSDGRGGYLVLSSDGNRFSQAQIFAIQRMKSGGIVSLIDIEYDGSKSGENAPFTPVRVK